CAGPPVRARPALSGSQPPSCAKRMCRFRAEQSPRRPPREPNKAGSLRLVLSEFQRESAFSLLFLAAAFNRIHHPDHARRLRRMIQRRLVMKKSFLVKLCLGALLVIVSASLAAFAQAPGASASSTTQISTGAGTPAGGNGTSGPEGVVYDGKGHVWVANQFTNTISEISTSNGALLATVRVGSRPVAIASDGVNSLWVTNLLDDTVMQVAANTGTIGATISVPGGPGAVIVAGKN